MSGSAPSPDSTPPALTPPDNSTPPSGQPPPSPPDTSSSPPPPAGPTRPAPPPTPDLPQPPPPPPDSSGSGSPPPPDSGGSERSSPPPPPSSSGDPPSPPPPSSGGSDPPPPPSGHSDPPPQSPPTPSSSPPSQPPPSSPPSQPPPSPREEPKPHPPPLSPDPSSPPQPGPPSPRNPTPPSPPPDASDPLPAPAIPSPPSRARPPPPHSNSDSRASLNPPSHPNHSSSNSSVSPPSSGGGAGRVAAGITLGVLVLAMAALCFVIVRKRRKRSDRFVNLYQPPPSYSVRSDGYYNNSGPLRSGGSQHSYAYSGPQSGFSNGYGSQRGGGYGFHSGGQESVGIGSTKSWFSYEELSGITNGFSPENMIGEGGFGCVYKGYLSDGKAVAVKQLKMGSGQGEREFKAEVEIISRVHHRHLVSLVGYCIANDQRLLVYEFVPNGTLEHHLHGKGRPVMEWTKRVKIAIGSAKGLAYLHEDCHPRIIHRDIKSANILLDNSFEAQVADFGLAKLSNDTHTHVSTRVMGTFGYLAPEYASSGKLTDRSDVYSFGVVLLELVTGRKPVDPSQPLGDESLVEWARPLLTQALESGDFQGLVDTRLENNYERNEMCRMIETAAACVRHSAPKRPRMIQVVRALDSEGEMADLTNGVKYGQSTVFQSNQYPTTDIQRFRRMAFGSGTTEQFSSEHQPSQPSGAGYSGECTAGHSREHWTGQYSSGEYPKSSSESETRSIMRKTSIQGSHRYNF